MIDVIGIDLGIKNCGYAIITEYGRLINMGIIKNSGPGNYNTLKAATQMLLDFETWFYHILPERSTHFLIELPQGFGNEHTAKLLSFIGGGVWGILNATPTSLHTVQFVHPSTWKTDRTKAQTHKDYARKYSKTKRDKIADILKDIPKSMQDDALDALCIAHYNIGPKAHNKRKR